MLMIPAQEIAAGDYSPDYGTVETVSHDEKETTFEIKFKNGVEITLAYDEEINLTQGGRFDR